MGDTATYRNHSAEAHRLHNRLSALDTDAAITLIDFLDELTDQLKTRHAEGLDEREKRRQAETLKSRLTALRAELAASSEPFDVQRLSTAYQLPSSAIEVWIGRERQDRKARIIEERKSAIAQAHKAGASTRAIADEHGLSPEQVRRILRRLKGRSTNP